MHKRCIAGILLAALLVSLCGCTSVFDKEYLSVRPYEEPSNLLTDADTTQIRNYAGLMRALNTMAAQYERSFVLAFGDYDGIIADDLAAACEELRTGTAIGAYCIESVSYETEQVIAYCEASITITYNRPESEVRSIYSAQTQKSILDCVVDALDRQKTQFAIQISTSTLETDDVAALVRSACLNQPQLVVDFPSIDVTVYSGSSNSQKIFGITLQYSVSESAVNDRRTQLDGDRIVGDDDGAVRRAAAHLRAVRGQPGDVLAVEHAGHSQELTDQEHALTAKASKNIFFLHIIQPPCPS